MSIIQTSDFRTGTVQYNVGEIIEVLETAEGIDLLDDDQVEAIIDSIYNARFTFEVLPTESADNAVARAHEEMVAIAHSLVRLVLISIANAYV